VIACPSCRRRVFSRSDILHATLRGSTQCRWCGRTLRLDLLSRWVLSCLLAILLPNALLYGDIFYSGHLFVVSMFLIYAGLALFSYVGFPLLSLEIAPEANPLNRRQSALLAGIILAAAIAIDGFIGLKIDADGALEKQGAPSAAYRN
jgi:hypothetical protein